MRWRERWRPGPCFSVSWAPVLLSLLTTLGACESESRQRRPTTTGARSQGDAHLGPEASRQDAGGGDAEAGDGSQLPPIVIPDGVPLEEFCGLYARVIRDQELRCDRSSDREIAEMVDFVQRRCERQFLASARAGVIEYDSVAMASCLEEVLARCEAETILSSETCLAARRGTLGEGVPCYASSECDQGYCPTESECPASCLADAGPLESCLGRRCARGTYCNAGNTCMWVRREGDPCSFDLECALGLTCVYPDLERLGEGSCRPKGGSGAGCGPTVGACEEGFRCVRQEAVPPDQAGQCLELDELPLGSVGEPCDGDRPCARGAFCLTPMWSLLGAEGECRPRRAAGEACEVGGEDLIWFFRGCDGALCHAVGGVTRGVCRSTQLGEPCAAASLNLDLGSTTRSYIERACSGLDQVCGGGELPRCEPSAECVRP